MNRNLESFWRVSAPPPAVPVQLGGDPCADVTVVAGVQLGDGPQIPPLAAVLHHLHHTTSGEPIRVESRDGISPGWFVERHEPRNDVIRRGREAGHSLL